MRGDRIAPFGLAVIATLLASTALSAHRLDEYLQAARLAIEPGRVELQLDLTPGSAVAEVVITEVDRDRDGRLSPGEQRGYAQRVLDALELRIDDRTLPVGPIEATFPDVQALRRGEGTIRLRMQAHLPRTLSGEHHLAFRNRHRPDVSVYLANALLPDGAGVAITAQRRDPVQRDLTIHYVVRNQWSASAPAWLLGALGLTLLTCFVAPRLRRRVRTFSSSAKNRLRVRRGKDDGLKVLAEV